MLFHCQTLILPIITAIIVEMPDSILVVKVGSVLNTNPTTINATMNRINLITYYSHMFMSMVPSVFGLMKLIE